MRKYRFSSEAVRSLTGWDDFAGAESLQETGLWGSAIIAAASLLAALATSSACSATDGSFAVDPVYQSSYCRKTHLPGLPDSLGSAVLLGLTFGLPVAVALGSTWLAEREGSLLILRVGLVVAALLTLGLNLSSRHQLHVCLDRTFASRPSDYPGSPPQRPRLPCSRGSGSARHPPCSGALRQVRDNAFAE